MFQFITPSHNIPNVNFISSVSIYQVRWEHFFYCLPFCERVRPFANNFCFWIDVQILNVFKLWSRVSFYLYRPTLVWEHEYLWSKRYQAVIRGNYIVYYRTLDYSSVLYWFTPYVQSFTETWHLPTLRKISKCQVIKRSQWKIPMYTVMYRLYDGILLLRRYVEVKPIRKMILFGLPPA